MITGSWFLEKIKTKEDYLKLKEGLPYELENLKGSANRLVNNYGLHKQWGEEYADKMFDFYYNVIDIIDSFEREILKNNEKDKYDVFFENNYIN